MEPAGAAVGLIKEIYGVLPDVGTAATVVAHVATAAAAFAIYITIVPQSILFYNKPMNHMGGRPTSTQH
jgi:hypothetical protein